MIQLNLCINLYHLEKMFPLDRFYRYFIYTFYGLQSKNCNSSQSTCENLTNFNTQMNWHYIFWGHKFTNLSSSPLKHNYTTVCHNIARFVEYSNLYLVQVIMTCCYVAHSTSNLRQNWLVFILAKGCWNYLAL